MNKSAAQHKDLIYALADRVHARAEEERARSGAVADRDRDLMAKARLAGWKPLLERGARKAG